MPDTSHAEAVRNAVTNIMTRRENGFRDFVAQLETFGNIGHDDAVAVANLYLKERFAKWDGQRYTVKHGAFFDAEVIGRAVAGIAAQTEAGR